MFLSDRSIRRRVADGSLVVDPFDDALVQPASVDVRLGGEFRWWVDDPAADDAVREVVRPDGPDPVLLPRWGFMLGHVAERVVIPDDLGCEVRGKSSLGRMGLQVHQTAGWIDPGFPGQIVLEFLNVGPRPVWLRPGMPVAQLTFALLDQPCERPYGTPALGSHYASQRGARRSWLEQSGTVVPG